MVRQSAASARLGSGLCIASAAVCLA
jgi:hypothetical protein